MTDLAPAQTFGPLTANPGSTTVFDDMVGALTVPAELTGGDIPEAMVMDGLVRGQAIVARSRSNQAMIGLRLDSGGQDIRIEVELSVDDTSWAWWLKRVPEELQHLPRTLNRVIEVTAQGRPCGAVVLSRQTADSGPTRGVLQLDVPGHLVQPEGLVMVEFDGYAGATGRDGILPSGMVGVRVDVVRAEIEGSPLATQISGGDTRTAMIRHEWAAITPGTDDHELVLQLVDDVQLPQLFVDKGGRYGRLAARAVRKGSKMGLSGARSAMAKTGRTNENLIRRVMEEGRLSVTAVDLQGRPVEVHAEAAPGSGRVKVTLPHGRAEAFLLRVHMDPSALYAAGFSTQHAWAVLSLS